MVLHFSAELMEDVKWLRIVSTNRIPVEEASDWILLLDCITYIQPLLDWSVCIGQVLANPFRILQRENRVW